MNYIKEINAFYDWLETNSLSTSGIVLWHALMHINNKAGWAEEFAVAISVLEAKTGLKKDAIYRARNRLQQLGRITWRSRKGNQSAVYSIIYFVSFKPTQSATQEKPVSFKPTQSATQPATQTATQTAHKVQPLYKLNKTKLNNNIYNNHIPQDTNIFSLIEQEFGRPLRPAEYQKVAQLQEEYAPELIGEALRRTVLNQAFSVKYLAAILRNWQSKGIRTLSDVEHEDMRYQKRKTKSQEVDRYDEYNQFVTRL